MKNNIKRAEGVFVHPRAYVAGDVILGEGANIWCGACIRGDIAPVVIGKKTNIQDNVSVHVGYSAPVTIGEGVTVGHNAVIHGCTIDDNVLIGMGAIVMDGAKIGKDSIVGAGTLIPPRKEIPSGVLAVGNPYKIVRALTDAEKEGIMQNAQEYLRLAQMYADDEIKG